jgi:hypothetical protein
MKGFARDLAGVVMVVPFLSPARAAAASAECEGTYGKGPEIVSIATGSPRELGLLKVLAEAPGEEERRNP